MQRFKIAYVFNFPRSCDDDSKNIFFIPNLNFFVTISNIYCGWFSRKKIKGGGNWKYFDIQNQYLYTCLWIINVQNGYMSFYDFRMVIWKIVCDQNLRKIFMSSILKFPFHEMRILKSFEYLMLLAKFSYTFFFYEKFIHISPQRKFHQTNKRDCPRWDKMIR